MNVHYNPGPKMADVMTVLEQDRTTPTQTRKAMISALHSLERLIGRPLATMPASVPQLREVFEGMHAAAHGITPKTLANIRSLCLKAIQTSELVPGVVMEKTKGRPHSPQWADLWSALAAIAERNSLSRLVTWCNARGLEPPDVDNAVVETMMAHMAETSLRANQHLVHRAVAKTWNSLVDRFPDKELTKVVVPVTRQRRKRVSLDDVPDSFFEDWNNFAAWASGNDRFADDGRQKPLKQSTIDNYFGRMHLAISLLSETGVEPSSIHSLADLTTVDAFKTIMRRLIQKSDGKATYEAFFLAGLLVRLAREWVKVDEETLARLRELASRIPEPVFEMTEKNKLLVGKFDDPDLRARFLSAPDRIWEEVAASKKRSRWRLAEAQAALAIQILMFMPLRLHNLATLAFDRHLFLRPGGKSSLIVNKEDMKSGNGVQFDIPPTLAERLIYYRHTLAPSIIGETPTILFCNSDGSAKSLATVRYLVQRYVKQYVGIHMNPHAYRHLAAKMILDSDPGAHVLVQHLLGHEKLETTATYYAGIDTVRAGRHHHALLEKSIATYQAEQASLRKSVRGSRGRHT